MKNYPQQVKYYIAATILFLFGTNTITAQTVVASKKTDTIKSTQLEEIKIEGKKNLYERKTDRLVFNVENSIIATGGTAMDALKVTPGIQVQNDAISMIGKSGMSVMINGRILKIDGDDLLNYLRSIPSASIKKIEVITTPPSKYDAQGNSGLINIILKKGAADSWNLNLRSSYTQRTYASADVGTDFNYRKDRLSVSSSLTAQKQEQSSDFGNKIYYPEDTWDKKTNRHQKAKAASGNFGIDYDISDKWTLGSLYMSAGRNINTLNNANTNILNLDESAKGFLTSNTKGTMPITSNSINLHSIHKLDTLGQKLSVDLDYFAYQRHTDDNTMGNTFDSNYILQPDLYYQNRADNLGKVKNYSAKADYELPAKWATLGFGGKLSFSKSDNDYKFYDNSTGDFIFNTAQSNVFQYKENVQALYGNMNKKINEKIDFQFGLRMENTMTDGYSVTLNQRNKYNYLKLFPTVYLSYKISDEKTLAVNYSKRIGRPGFEQLNPFKTYLDQYTYHQGNPFLRPSYSNNLEVSLSTKKFQHQLFGSYNTNEYASLTINDDVTKLTKIYPQNFITSYNVAAGETYTFNKLKWWNSFVQVTAYYTHSKSSLPNTFKELEAFSGNISANNEFIFNESKTIMCNVNYAYSLPQINNYSQLEALGNLSAGIRFLLLDKNLNISLAGDDILKTMKIRTTEYANNIKTVSRYYYDNRYFRLSLSYNFGNKKIQARKRAVGNEEEKGRIGG